VANRPSQLPADRPGGGGRSPRPEERPNWKDWSNNRDTRWQNRVDHTHDAWNNWSQNQQGNLDKFRENQPQRWSNLQQSAKDWQNHRDDLWNYRADRANEIRSKARDNYYDHFDDHWWHTCGWGVGWRGTYPANPWWWWAPATLLTTTLFVDSLASDPVYIDYGLDSEYPEETILINDQPVPVEHAESQVVDTASTMSPPPPPLPPPQGERSDWLALGVYALTQQEKGDPVMFLQLSVSREGKISGAYSNILSQSNRPVAGLVDKTSQRVAWRIGDNTDSIFETTVANLTLDVAPVAIHFGKSAMQTWLMVRLPEPAPDGQPAEIPDVNRTPPKAKK
jgi:hypothetical protein